MIRKLRPFFLSISAFFMLGACSTGGPPIREMVFASASIKAAERVGAEKFSPDLFRKAESEFWRAKSYYLTKRYDECQKSAYNARRFSEKAEMQSELKKSEAGYEGLDQ